jgi:hypothetical protein
MKQVSYLNILQANFSPSEITKGSSKQFGEDCLLYEEAVGGLVLICKIVRNGQCIFTESFTAIEEGVTANESYMEQCRRRFLKSILEDWGNDKARASR